MCLGHIAMNPSGLQAIGKLYSHTGSSMQLFIAAENHKTARKITRLHEQKI